MEQVYLLLLCTCFSACAIGVTLSKCPNKCSCFEEEMNGFNVRCLDGGLKDPLPLLDMPQRTRVLIVSAPYQSENKLSLGPIFRGLPNLQEIQILHSQIPALGEHSFWGLKELKLLNISHNSISTLLPANFRGPGNLISLDLSYNEIESAPSAVFRYLKNLRTLNLSHNQLLELVPKVFFGLMKLEDLDISYNPLGALQYEQFSDISQLKRLKCISCGLQIISPMLFNQLTHLKIVDFSDNRLISLPTAEHMTNISEMNLDGNLITSMTKKLNYFPLRVLSLSHNRIVSIHKEVFTNYKLKYLNISYNRLSSLDSEVFTSVLPHIEVFDVSGNSLLIENLAKIITNAPQLRILGIGDLGLTHIPHNSFRHLRNLEVLNVSSNYLSHFSPKLIYSIPQLRVLDLSGNNFRRFSANLISAISALARLDYVFLEENPWQCDECYIRPLLNWLNTNSDKIKKVSTCKVNSTSNSCLTCAGSNNFNGVPLVNLRDRNIVKCSSDHSENWLYWDDESAMFDNENPPTSEINSLGSSEFTTVAVFFRDHLALIVGIACGLLGTMILVTLTSLLYSKHFSANYYTTEDEKHEELIKHNYNTSSSSTIFVEPKIVPHYEPMAISKVHSKMPICSLPSLHKYSADPPTASLSSSAIFSDD